MGIRQLQSYLNQHVENGFIEVSIVEEIEKCKREKQRNPILVIDLIPIFHLMFQNKKDVIYGGRWKIYYDLLDALFIKIKETGVELVFFEDGLIERTKYRTWLKRQNTRYDEHTEIIDCIIRGCSVDEILKTFEVQLASGFATVIPIMEAIAKKYGTLVYSVTKDCDVEMVRYANVNNVLAIISDDTDFLIFKGDWKLWSTRLFNLSTLKTFELNRTALRTNLDLNDDELAILSTIAGNDFISFEEIANAIRRNFRYEVKVRFPNIAVYIKTAKLANEKLHNRAKKIAIKMLGSAKPETLRRVRQSLSAYNHNFEDESYPPLLQTCVNTHKVTTFKILKRFPRNFTLVFFDLRQTDMPSYHDIVVPFFQRLLGILFFSQRNWLLKRKFEIYSRRSHDEPFERIYVEPIYPLEARLPELIQLLDPDNSELDDERYEMLKWMINSKTLSSADLTGLPTCFFLDVLTLVLMQNVGAISSNEADVFLFTSMKVERNEIPADIEYPEYVDHRAFRLAFAFGKIREVISNSLDAIGLNRRATLSKFDGVFFQKCYLQMKNSGKCFADELEGLKEFRFYDLKENVEKKLKWK